MPIYKNKIGNPVVAHKKIAEAIHPVPHRLPMLYTMYDPRSYLVVTSTIFLLVSNVIISEI